MTAFAEDFHNEIDILVQSNKLSKTGTGRFDPLKKKIAAHVTGEEDQVYVISCARPNNLNIRLTQGAAQHRHNIFGLGVIPNASANTVKSGLKAARTFIGSGKAQYNAVGVAVQSAEGKWIIGGIIESAGAGIIEKFLPDFPDLLTDEVETNGAANSTSSATGTSGENRSDRRFAQRFEIPLSERKSKSDLPIQILVHGCPGSGKSFEVHEWAKTVSKHITVVFHPETTYSEFVGVFRPFPVYRITDDEFITSSGENFDDGEPYVTYRFVAGPLLEAYCYAVVNPSESVALVIEELSRANASLVFGDMLQLLDRFNDGDFIGSSVYPVTPKPEIQEFLLRYGIADGPDCQMRFPPNLHIWATMNRSDQNARQIDTAFLRRWKKKHMSYTQPSKYGKDLISCPKNQSIEWDDLRFKINSKLIDYVPEDKFIGPYFLPRSSLGDKTSFAEDLFGYLWNDVLKTRSREFFKFKTLSEVISAWEEGTENPFKDIELI
jgi:hypothetical protein